MARIERTTPMEDASIGSPTQDRSDRYARDEVLRRAGWEIWSRPKRGPNLWRHRDGRIVTEKEALREAGRK